MSAVVEDDDGRNIGSAYEIVGGDFAWSVVVEHNGVVDCRRGRQKDEMMARYAMVAGAKELGVKNPVLVVSAFKF